jgi:hypothetical protein
MSRDMTKFRRDRERREKTRLQKARVEWKKANPDDAAVKDFLNANASVGLAMIRAGRLSHRKAKAAAKAQAREARREAFRKLAEDQKKSNAAIRERIIKSRREPPPASSPKVKRHLLPAFMRRMFAGARQGK